jgi:hypothetical protein
MKKSILLVALAVFLLNVYSQEKKETSKTEKQINVPEVVKKAFATQFPKVAKVNWVLEKTGEYEAEFNSNKIEMSAVFDEKGILLETESEIKEAALPQTIKSVLAKDFAGYKIDEIAKTEAKDAVTYEMAAKKDKKEYGLVFDKNGKLLKQEEEKEDEDKK